jgi:crotonobetainyl-CoA:carnitine CoA-transferase CaiB-like acyl-CoA transferase
MRSPLEGVRVIDFTQVMAGPLCTMLLGDLGADVIKIEPPDTGDLSRSMGGARLQLRGNDRAPFMALNRNKRSVVLDLKEAADRATCQTLLRTADVVVENFRPGTARRLGIDYETIAQENPRVVYASISGFGQSGPYADRPGFDLIAQAMAGLMSVTGEPAGAPVKCGPPVADLAAGLYAVNGILAALLARTESGRGQYLETSLFEAALGLSPWESCEYWATGEPPQPFGSAHRLSAPYQALRTQDGHLVIAALKERQWERLCAVMDRNELLSDPRFESNAARLDHLPDLTAELERTLKTAPTNVWVERFLAAGVPAGPLLNYQQVFADPHTKARAMVKEIEHPVEGVVRTLGFPVKLHGTPLVVRRPPPLLGEHTEEVLRELPSAKRAS